MEAHARAPLSPIGRRRVVDRVVCEGWSVAAAAAAAGVSAPAPGDPDALRRRRAAPTGARAEAAGAADARRARAAEAAGGPRPAARRARRAGRGTARGRRRSARGGRGSWARAARRRRRGRARAGRRPRTRRRPRARRARGATSVAASRPRRVARVGQQRPGGVVGDLVPASGRAVRRRTAPEQPGRARRRHLLELARRDREQRDLGVGGRERGGGLDARLPPRLGYPDDDSHQTTCRANHSASVEASRIGGHRQRAEPHELADVGVVVVGVEHAPPEQRRERADVGQVRPDVDADQHREHRARRRRRPRRAGR